MKLLSRKETQLRATRLWRPNPSLLKSCKQKQTLKTSKNGMKITPRQKSYLQEVWPAPHLETTKWPGLCTKQLHWHCQMSLHRNRIPWIWHTKKCLQIRWKKEKMKSNLKCNVRAREFRCSLTRVCFWIRLRPTILLRLHCLRSLKVMMMSQSTILISLKSNPKTTMTMIPICQHLRETLRLSLLMQLFSTTHRL